MRHWQLLLDEHISPDVAAALNELEGCYVEALRNRGRLGEDDWDIVPWCIQQEFCIVTGNGKHFLREHENVMLADGIHRGIFIVDGWLMPEIYWGLRYLMVRCDPDQHLNQCIPLEPAPRDFVEEHRETDAYARIRYARRATGQ